MRCATLLVVLLTAAMMRGDVPHSLRVEVLQPAGPQTDSSHAFVTVGNVERIRIRVTVDSTGLDERFTVGTSLAPVLNVSAASVADGRPVLVKSSVSAVSANQQGVTVDMLLEIPVSPDERRRVLEGFVDDLIREASEKERQMLVPQRQQSIAALERLFFQNLPGDYSLCVEVTDPRLKFEKGEILLRVEKTGTFADTLRQRPRRQEAQ